jgi:cytochrome P450
MWHLLVLIGVLLFIVYRFIKFWILDPWSIHRDYWKQGIPGQYTPIIGDVLDRRRASHAVDPFSYTKEMADKFGDYYHTSFGPTACLSISDPSLIEGVFKTNARAYHKAAFLQEFLGSLLGYESIVLAEDEKHTRHRRLLAPVFQHQNINSMISLMAERTFRFINKWTEIVNDKNQPLTLDMHQEMSSLTLDIITGCAFGTEITKDNRLHETIFKCITVAVKELEKRMFNMVMITPILNRLPLPSKLRIDKSRRDIKHIVQNIINQRKKGLTKSACKGENIISFVFLLVFYLEP